MSYPTVQGTAVEGLLFREAQVDLGKAFASSTYKFFLSGTSTPANVYQNGALTTPFPTTGVVTSDAFGRFPAIYLDPSVIYRVQFFNNLSVQQWQVDPYTSQLSTVGTSALSAFGIQIAPTGEIIILAPNTGGSGVSLTLNAGSLGSAALRISSTLPGNSAIIVNSSATTGAQVATFAATNKPGTTTSAPAGWLPITCDGVQYYIPLWFDNSNFTPYTANPSAVGEVINASSVNFGGNGLTTATGGTASPSNWFTPTSAGIGAGYYINITRTSGTAGTNFSAAQGAWTNITGSGLTISTTGTSGTVNGTYQLSTSVTGSPVVASGTITLTTFAVTHTYTSGTGATETTPAGASFLTINAIGGGGSGQVRSAGAGQGGGGGGYCVSTSIAVTAGQTFTYTVGAGGAAVTSTNLGNVGSASTVTGTGVSIAAGGGQAMTGSGGPGGTASGGNTTNTAGQTGGTISTNFGGNNGNGTGGGIPGGGSPGGGSSGVGVGSSTLAGGNGQIQFIYT